VVGLVKDENDNDDWDWDWDWGWLGARGRVIFLLGTAKMMCDTEVYFAKGILVDVWGPQLGECMVHRMDDVLHHSISDQTVLCLCAINPSRYHWADDREWAGTVVHKRVDVVLKAKCFPEGPMCICFFGTFISDPSSGIFLDKAEASAERILIQGWNSCQGIVCGNAVLK
jgi:hypothetical protein